MHLPLEYVSVDTCAVNADTFDENDAGKLCTLHTTIHNNNSSAIITANTYIFITDYYDL